MRFETGIDIDASPERIWRVMTDVARWPEFLPTVTELEFLGNGQGDGPLGLGSRVRIKQPGLPVMVWQVTEFTEGGSFVWQATSGGVTTVAGHAITPRPGGGSLLLTIDQSGLPAPLVGLLTGGRT
ncbi:SRPBCC family protein, partial [Sphaerimonospora thailandensis]|uniref:SRPBCC family protein n=1 Tax=Sphaerimonospora thailandensis TaxID=795644 RepID=UPI00194EC381